MVYQNWLSLCLYKVWHIKIYVTFGVVSNKLYCDQEVQNTVQCLGDVHLWILADTHNGIKHSIHRFHWIIRPCGICRYLATTGSTRTFSPLKVTAFMWTHIRRKKTTLIIYLFYYFKMYSHVSWGLYIFSIFIFGLKTS